MLQILVQSSCPSVTFVHLRLVAINCSFVETSSLEIVVIPFGYHTVFGLVISRIYTSGIVGTNRLLNTL